MQGTLFFILLEVVLNYGNRFSRVNVKICYLPKLLAFRE